jgi:hypothetical protein
MRQIVKAEKRQPSGFEQHKCENNRRKAGYFVQLFGS